jgi:NAD(P)-dependent dehydrogenase (short-subunit alcohol dehydrogenase family)
VRTIVITGVSRGLGAALFDVLAGRGDRLLAIGRTFTAEQERLARAESDRIRLLPADLADAARLPTAADLRPVLAGATEVVLIHNAAVVEPIGAVGTLPAAALAGAVAVNLTAPMLLTNALLGATAPAVRILFVSSGAARRPPAGWAVYSTTKRAAEVFFEALAAEHPALAVVSVNPGMMDTGMQADIRAASFPERARFVSRYEEGELPAPAAVARRIVAEHLS